MIVFVFSVFQCLVHDNILCFLCSSVWVKIIFVFSLFQCLGQTGTVVGIDEDHDIVVSYPSGNR